MCASSTPHGHHDDAQIAAALAQLSRGGSGGAVLEEMRDAGSINAIGLECNREMRNYATWAGGRHEDLIERIAVDLDFLVVAGP